MSVIISNLAPKSGRFLRNLEILALEAAMIVALNRVSSRFTQAAKRSAESLKIVSASW